MSSNRELEIVVGSVRPVNIYLFDERDEAEALGAATKATFTVKSDSTTTLLSRDTDAANLTIDTANSRLTATVSQVEADALTPGTYYGGVAVEFAEGWYQSDPFTVKIIAASSSTI